MDDEIFFFTFHTTFVSLPAIKNFIFANSMLEVFVFDHQYRP